MWNQLCGQKTDTHYHCSDNNRFLKYFSNSRVELSTIIVPRNRLHTLVETDDNHHEKHRYTIDNAKSSHSEVAAVSEQTLIDKYHYHRRCRIHQKRRKPDSNRI